VVHQVDRLYLERHLEEGQAAATQAAGQRLLLAVGSKWFGLLLDPNNTAFQKKGRFLQVLVDHFAVEGA